MAKNNLNKSEDIFVKVDQNNLLYVDPNSVMSDGEVSFRNISQENLSIFVNLEADLIPRSTLIAQNNESTLTQVASGTLNFLKKQGGGDYDSTWTDSYSNEAINIDGNNFNNNITTANNNDDKTGQSFGIDSININIKGANFIPQININFVDVRGKTLFESPENSPYKSFFHLPWPIFYLTVKGYYGKAIKYRLHMTKFTTRYNQNGNFEINTTFVGSTYAYLADIPINGILNAPYMYAMEKTSTGKFNPNTGKYEKKISKSSKGFTVLKSVYDEYVEKGYLPKDFTEKPRTLKEIIQIARSLDKILEREIFDQVVDMRIFSGIKEFETILENFTTSIVTWQQKHCSTTVFTDNSVEYYFLLPTETGLKNVTGPKSDGTLENILNNYVSFLKKTKLYTEEIKKKTGGFDFNKLSVSFSNNIINIENYYRPKDGKYGIAINKIIDNINDIKNSFNVEKTKVQKSVEDEINKIFKDKEKGLGFVPTIRNIFAIICANADTYIRLLKDVHVKSFDTGKERAIKIGKLGEDDAVFPWPEIYRITSNKDRVLAYPGHSDLQKTLDSTNPALWPEIEFLENFYGVATKRIDSLADKEGGVQNVSFIYPNDSENVDTPRISTLFYLMNYQPYLTKAISSILYEIWERSRYVTYFDSFSNDSIKELADNEFDILYNLLKEDYDVLDFLKRITSQDLLKNQLISVSPYERYPYLKDQLPTVDYLKTLTSKPYKIEQYFNLPKNRDKDDKFIKLSDNIKNYTIESYRKDIYPFNSTTYLSYINKTNYGYENFNLGNVLEVKTEEGLISSKLFSPTDWVRDGYDSNIFSQKLYIGSGYTNEHILNTPYFHNQLYSDLTKPKTFGKYVGSAYLLLNSLPFKELSDTISDTTRLSSMFKEVGASHYVPYHLMVKWGSIYHRYKTYLTEGYDILTGATTSNNDTSTKDLIISNFYDVSGNTQQDYIGFERKTETYRTVRLDDNEDVGFYPFYQSVFRRVLTNGDLFDPYDPSTYSGYTSSSKINLRWRNFENLNYWTAYVKNSGYDPNDKTYMLLPSDGGNIDENLKSPTLEDSLQSNLRVIWNDSMLDEKYGNIVFPNYGEYNLSFDSTREKDDEYRIGGIYRKIYDLIAVFGPNVLDEFEKLFLDFATDKIGELEPIKKFENVKHDNFQTLLKSMVTVNELDGDPTDVSLMINKLKTQQELNLKSITEEILGSGNKIKLTLGNPKEIDPYVWFGYTNIDNTSSFTTNEYNSIQDTLENNNLLKLYVGEEPEVDVYKDFFIYNNIEFNEENILNFRPLIHIWAGYLKLGYGKTKKEFQSYLSDKFFLLGTNNLFVKPAVTRQSIFLTMLLNRFTSLKASKPKERITLAQGYNEEPIKLELYNYFKSFNDKWISGNSIGQKLLIEEFLFLDKRNSDIGDLAYLSMDKLISLEDVKNEKQSFYGVISMLIQGTGFDMRALPAYVNFYGLSSLTSKKIIPSKKVANNLFGTFLEVDYQESSPKIILQYVGVTSKHLDLKSVNRNGYLFKDDTFNIIDPKCPLIITNPIEFAKSDLKNSNKVVAFEVNIGDQNQSMFKGVSLSQDSIKNTTESFIVMEQLGRSESGSATHQVDVGLFDIYRQASYTCEITCMGNAMIQPTMYFYLKNIPMFRGTYWITEVSHQIKNNTMETTFKGVRMKNTGLPDPNDSFLASYRTLFEKITNKAVARQKEIDQQINGEKSNETTISTNNGSYTIDMGEDKNKVNGEQIVPVSQINEFGVKYNGFDGEKYVQLVKYNNVDYLRAVVTIMDGKKYPIDPSQSLSILRNTKKITINSGDESRKENMLWKDVSTSKNYFYSLRFALSDMVFVPQGDKILTAKTTFFNPKKNIEPIIVEGYSLEDTITPQNIRGPVHVGPNVNGYGIALSRQLAKDLGVDEGGVVYFIME